VLVLASTVACSGEDHASGSRDAAPVSDAAAECAIEVAPGPGLVVTDRGVVRGVDLGAVYAYKGIPYAAPPVGALRWRAPEPAACFPRVHEAQEFGPRCVQHEPGALSGQEDCLTLNVWAPAPPSSTPLPVLFFLHAGDNLVGSVDDTLDGVLVYDGAHLAEHGPAVVVTANYRLGALGFLPHPDFAAEDPEGATGNYGLRDQIAALRWVQRNIAGFGGDPLHVLLFGLSAGAVDTCALVASPAAAGLFQRALLHSGNCSAVMWPELAQSTVREATTRLGCDGAPDVPACLRSASSAEVAALPADLETSDFNPFVDGAILQGVPLEVVRSGAHNRVPLVFGTTAQEYSMLIEAVWPDAIESQAEYRDAVRAIVGSAPGGDLVLAQYPASEYPSYRDALVAIFTDVIFDCPNRQAARAVPDGDPVWRYLYAHPFQTPGYASYRASHGFDVMLLFHALGAVQPTEAERALADEMVASWVTFARDGVPAPIGGVGWPGYERTEDPRLILDTPSAVGTRLRSAQCDFWDAVQ
jgi:para-nitrobenzyl esterase